MEEKKGNQKVGVNTSSGARKVRRLEEEGPVSEAKRSVTVQAAAENAAALQHRSWVTVTATVGAKEHPIYDGVGPWLEAASVTPAQPPKEELVYFLR